jgi:hypothetical protein
MDELSKMDALVAYGEQLGEMILHDQFDRAQGILPPVAEA